MNLDELIKSYSGKTPEQYANLMNEKMNKVIPVISSYTLTAGDLKLGGIDMLVHIIVGALWSDHEVTGLEVAYLASVLQQCVDKSYTMDHAAAIVINAGKNFAASQSLADALVDGLGGQSKALKEDLVALCIVVMLLDGKITADERAYLERLLA